VAKEKALVRREAAPLRRIDDAPPLVLAKSLEDAPPRAFVHVDNQGRVRSPARFRALQAMSYGAAGVLAVGAPIAYGALLGVPGVGVGLAIGMTALYGWMFTRARRLDLAVRLLAHDRLDEAEALCEKVMRSWGCPKPVRALAERTLALVLIRRGRLEDALTHQRVAMAIYARMRSRSIYARCVQYDEVATLVGIGRVGEARQRLEQLGKIPDGEYLRLHHFTADLYVSFGEGEHRLSADELHERTHMALGINRATVLLALCAWAHLQKNDEDMAWHLLREAFDRWDRFPIDKAMPKLWDWMTAHAQRAGIKSTDPADD
jgi:hypothetical protein